MTFRPCFVVPALDPGTRLAGLVAELAGHGLPIYLIDDGSTPEEGARMRALAEAQPLVRLTRLDPNQGKGAAVQEGFRRAAADGCTHALQVDADHQHDLAAVPAFLDLGRAHPGAVVAGYPVFDATAPKARRYGRRANDLWVNINTLSADIRDSLCGFRLYPLAPALALMRRVRLAPRMAFDTEVIVRLHWRGVPVLSAPVRVTYPEGGPSHFRPGPDTLRLIALHVGFFFSMLARSPHLLWRRRPDLPWHRIQERGGAWGLRFMAACHRHLGARVMRAFASVATPYFLITGGRARAASRDYLARLHRHAGPLPGLAAPPGLLQVFRHFQAFTRATVDTFLAWSGADLSDQVDFPGYAEFLARRRSGEGGLVLAAHLGCLEMARALGRARGLDGMNAVVYSENAVRFHRILQDANPGFQEDLVQVAEVGPDTAIRLKEKVDRGEFLFITGDRTPPAETGRTVRAAFLGEPAAFPLGPYLLAHLLQCPVYVMFCCWDGARYQVTFERLADRIHLPRTGRDAAMATWARRYAEALEAQCRAHPYAWFNFFSFWASPGGAQGA